MKVLWLGQAGLLFVSGKTKIMVDPYLSDSLSKENHEFARRIKLNKKLFKVKPDALIITNSHSDHADIETVERIVKHKSKKRSLTVLSCESVFTELIDIPTVCQANHIMLEDFSEWTVGNLHIRAVPAKTDDKSAFGVIITDLEDNKRYYVTGDTLYNEKIFESIPNDIYATFLPINGEYGSMNVIDAKRFAQKIESVFYIPIHFGMFDKINPKDFYSRNTIIPSAYKIISFDEHGISQYKKSLDSKFNEKNAKEIVDQSPVVTYEEAPNESEQNDAVIIENKITSETDSFEALSDNGDIPYDSVTYEKTEIDESVDEKITNDSDGLKYGEEAYEDNGKPCENNPESKDEDYVAEDDEDFMAENDTTSQEIPFEEGDWSELLGASDDVIDDASEDDGEFEGNDIPFDDFEAYDDFDEFDEDFDEELDEELDEDEDFCEVNEKSFESCDDSDKIDAYIREIEKFERGETTDFSKID